MENINTLFFSGGAMKCLSILGSLKYLFENNIINNDFKNIKDIYFVSGSSIYLTPLLIGFSMDSTIDLFKRINYKGLSGIDNMKLQNLFDNYGLTKITDYKFIISTILKAKNIPEEITLKEFYELIKINLHFRVINVNKQRNEYLNKDNSPDLSYIDAICMTSCIPLLFEPIEYNGCKYVDGGVNNNFPYEKLINKKNFLGINILSSKISIDNKGVEKKNIKDFYDYISILYNIYGAPSTFQSSINHIKILINGSGVNFNHFSDTIDETLLLGYETTKNHFSNFQKHIDSMHVPNEGQINDKPHWTQSSCIS